VGDNFNTGPTSISRVSCPVSVNNASWEPKYILGEATVHPDGSAAFKVPARTPVYFQCIDENGQCAQTMRSWSTLQPGETFGCVGCHENKNQTPSPKSPNTLALKAGAADLKPFYNIRRGFSFVKDIQPILDRHCVKCHHTGGKNDKFLLTGDRVDDARSGRFWTQSYLSLTNLGHPNKLISWVHPQTLAPMIPPYNAGSAQSGIFKHLKNHNKVKLSRRELDTLAVWIDLAVPFSQDYFDQNAFDEKQMAQYERFFNKRKYCELMERLGVEEFLGDGEKPKNYRMYLPVRFGDPLKKEEIYRDLLADSGVTVKEGITTPKKGVSQKPTPHYAWSAEFPAEMSFDRIDVILDQESPTGEFPVTATLEFEDGKTATVEIAGQAVRQTFYITRHDARTLKISMARKLPAKFELFGRTKTDLFDRLKNVARRKDMPKYKWTVNGLRKYKVSHPANLFLTIDKWRAERKKKK